MQTEAPGLNPEQVEVLVTQAVEGAVNGLPGLATLRSNSIQGVSVVTATFRQGSDIYRARQLVGERLAGLAGRLPQGVAAPAMTALTSSTSAILLIGLTSDTRSLMDLRTVADWRVRLRLLAAPGVGEVLVYGGDIRSIRIQVRPQDLIRFRLGLNDVLAAGRKATGVRGAGFIDTANQRITLQTEGQSVTPAAVARTVLINEGGASVVLGDVADVVAGPEPAISAALVDGKPGILMMIGAQYGTNTVEVAAGVEAALAELQPGLVRDGITLRNDLFRPAGFVAQATGHVLQALALGGLLVVVVLAVFLFDWRTALISATAIPLSLIGAVLVLGAFGQSLNTMTLGGLAIAIGEVVDDAVIGVENAMRRLRENRRLALPRPEGRVVFEAILEVRVSVAYATFAVLLVFLPVLALSGVPGRLFGPLALAYILAVLASLVVALTLTPALARLLLAGRKALPAREPPVTRAVRHVYVRLLEGLSRHPVLVGLAGLLVVLGSAVPVPSFGGAFLPDLKEGHFILHMASAPGTSLKETLRLGGHVTAGLKAIPGVRAVAQQVGRAEAGYDLGGTHESEIHVDLTPGLDGAAQERAEAGIRALMAATPGATFSLKTFLTERIEEVVSGFTAPVVVSVYGADLDRIDAAARDVARELAEVRGAADIQLRSPTGLPQITIALRPVDLRHWGLDAIEVLELARTAFQGDTVGQSYEGNAVFNVVVVLDPAARSRLSSLGDLPLRTPGGSTIRLSQVADVYETMGRYAIAHHGAQRVRVVTANVEGRDIASFTQAVKRKIDREVKLPPGVYVGIGGAGGGARTGPPRPRAPCRPRRARDPAPAGGRHRVSRQPPADPRQPALRRRRRGAGRGGDRRARLPRRHRRLRDAVRHLVAQHHHDDRPLRASRARRGAALDPGHGDRGRRRPAGADPDDLARHRPRPPAPGARRRRARPRDRGADGDRDPRRARQLDAPEPLGPAGPGGAVRAFPSPPGHVRAGPVAGLPAVPARRPTSKSVATSINIS